MSKQQKDHGVHTSHKGAQPQAANNPQAPAGAAGESGNAAASALEGAEQTGAQPGIPRGEHERLKGELEAREREVAELKDKYLRVLAESENARKRMRQQNEETVRLERENLLRELLPIVDNLERAVEAARRAGNGEPIVEGVEITLRSILDFLRAKGVTPQIAVGKPFDPQFHEAVEEVESAEHKPSTVVTEYHRGYHIGGRVLRPARVAVAKGPQERSEAEGRMDGGGEKDGEGDTADAEK